MSETKYEVSPVWVVELDDVVTGPRVPEYVVKGTYVDALQVRAGLVADLMQDGRYEGWSERDVANRVVVRSSTLMEAQ